MSSVNITSVVLIVFDMWDDKFLGLECVTKYTSSYGNTESDEMDTDATEEIVYFSAA